MKFKYYNWKQRLTGLRCASWALGFFGGLLFCNLKTPRDGPDNAVWRHEET